MFGRKRKKDEEAVGLAGLGTASVSVGPAPTVSVSASPPHATAPQTATAPGPSASAAPGTIPGFPADAMPTGAMPTNAAAALGQILSGHGPVGELVAQIKADPEAFRQRVMAQAQAAGVSTYVMSPQWISPAGGTGAGSSPTEQPRHVDVIDELTKAADLHHAGALTDAEFEALKKKLLGA